MANVIYADRAKGAGASIGHAGGQGVTLGFQREMVRQERVDQTKRVTQMIDKIKTAGNRKGALEAAALATTNMAEDLHDVNSIYALVDKFYPVRDETPHAVDVVGPDNKKQRKFVEGGRLPGLNDPANVESMFGPGFRLHQQEQEYEFFHPDATGKGPTAAGKGPLSARPEGARTREELDFKRQSDADVRAEARDLRADDAARLAREREDRIAKHMNTITSKLAEGDRNRVADNFRSDSRAGEGLMMRGLGKMLPDGTFGFDDDNKQDLFNKRVALFNELLAGEYTKNPTGKFVNYAGLADKAIKAHPTKAELPKPKQIPKADETKKIGGKNYYRYGTQWFDAEQR